MSYSLANIGDTGADVEIVGLDKTYLNFVSDRQNQAFRETIYTIAVGSAIEDTKVVLRQNYDAKNDVARYSIRLTTHVVGTDPEVDTLDGREIEAVVAWNVPGRAMFDTALIFKLISSAFSTTWNMDTSGVPQLDALNAINHGTVNNLY